MKKKNVFIVSSLIVSLGFFTACEKDGNPDDDMSSKGTAKIEITDGPVDDASVSGTFVTISDIQLDGESLEGFNKTTVDLMAYQNGNTNLLGNYDVDAKSYSEIKLILDFEKDENGDSPGCYVYEEEAQAKHKLTSESNEVESNHDMEVESEKETSVLIDFDLRKCIKREDNGSDKYEFVTQSELESGIRFVDKENTGHVEGNCDDQVSESDEIVVYAYAKGDYNHDQEVNGQGQSNVRFANAETSSKVDANGEYSLNFLEEGEYELYFCSYKENDQGEMELNGSFTFDLLGTVKSKAVTVESSSTVSLDVSLLGLLDIL